jgi:hypothetical protein
LLNEIPVPIMLPFTAVSKIKTTVNLKVDMAAVGEKLR